VVRIIMPLGRPPHLRIKNSLEDSKGFWGKKAQKGRGQTANEPKYPEKVLDEQRGVARRARKCGERMGRKTSQKRRRQC